MLKLDNLPKNTRCSCVVEQSRQHKPSFLYCKGGLWCLWYGSCWMSLTKKKAKILMVFEVSGVLMGPKGDVGPADVQTVWKGDLAAELQRLSCVPAWLCTAGPGSQLLSWGLLKHSTKSQMSSVPAVLLAAPHPTWPACREGSEHTALPSWLEPFAGSLCFGREM